MKFVLGTTVLALLLLVSAPARLTTAAGNTAAANGDFQFSIDNGPTRYVQFNAKIQNDGSTQGHLTFSGPSAATNTDVNGKGVPEEAPANFMISVDFDCLVVKGNRAVMSGAVSQSSQERLVGKRVLLVVEDNGEGNNAPAPDRVTWGLYRPVGNDWIPQDAEREDDAGAMFTWLATDAERPDDPGVSSKRDETVGCQSFSLSSYSFLDIRLGDGGVQVKP